MLIQIVYWKTTYSDLKYKQNQTFEYSTRKRNLIIDDILSKGYSVMIRKFQNLVIYIDKGRFGQS